MQGEGQEFESPRLHHLRSPGVHLKLIDRSPDSCPPDPGGHRPADRWRDLGPEARKGRTLTTGYVIGRNEEVKIFDFAVLSELFRYWILINP